MMEKYESEQALSEHSNGAALAELLSALEAKLSRDLDVQLLVPHPDRKTGEGRTVTARHVIKSHLGLLGPWAHSGPG
jgi:hypothetical protein